MKILQILLLTPWMVSGFVMMIFLRNYIKSERKESNDKKFKID